MYARVYNNLETSQKNGGNQVCFGNSYINSIDDDVVETKVDYSVVDEYDAIQMKTFQAIAVSGSEMFQKHLSVCFGMTIPSCSVFCVAIVNEFRNMVLVQQLIQEIST